MALTYLRIEHDVVVIRRWPRRKRRVPRREIDRFDVLKKGSEENAGTLIWIWGPLMWPREPYDYVALLMKDGSSMRVPTRGGQPSVVAIRLNNELIRSR